MARPEANVVALRPQPWQAADAAIAPRLQLTLFGSFRLIGPEGPVDVGSKKVCALIAVLALSDDEPVSREQLIALLWGSHFEAQARQNLRQALSRARAMLGSDVIATSGELVRLRAGVLACDVATFESLALSGIPQDRAAAIALYNPSLLDNVRLREEAWIEWVERRRARLEALALDTLLRAGADAVDADPALALQHATRACALDNFREEAHRLAIRALAGLGRKAEAMRRYEQLTALLQRELGVPPASETRALAESLQLASATKVAPAPAVPIALRAPFPDRPSIAVLPFANLTGDAAQEHFIRGMAEDIITELSRFRWLLVIARDSSFVYGDKTDLREIGRQLGVRYLLKGSFRRAGDQVRVTASLIEAETGSHIAAEKYDGRIGEMFALQDEITAGIVTAIEPSLFQTETARARAKPTESLDAYGLYLQALPQLRQLTEESVRDAEQKLRRAIALDPNYSYALAALAECLTRQWLNGWTSTAGVSDLQAECLATVHRAVAADPQNGLALATAAYIFACHNHRFAEGLDYAGRALQLHPNSAQVRFLCGGTFVHCGEPDAALRQFEMALRLSPLDPRRYLMLTGHAMSHFYAKRFDQAEHWARRSLAENDSWCGTRRYLAACLALVGRIDEARAEVAEILRIQPNSTVARSFLNSFRHGWMYDMYVGGLRMAGLPEG